MGLEIQLLNDVDLWVKLTCCHTRKALTLSGELTPVSTSVIFGHLGSTSSADSKTEYGYEMLLLGSFPAHVLSSYERRG